MDTLHPDDRVGAVVALKALPAAKSRMATVPAPVRERLARCMAVDTLAALAAVVDQIIVITDQPDLPAVLDRHGLGVRVLAEPLGEAGAGSDQLNRALAYGDAALRAEGVACVLACVGDLPALRAASVAEVLAASVGHQRAFLADHDHHGTTMLVARRVPLDPSYGTEIVDGSSIGSAERHRRSGAHPLTLGQVLDARWDVDTIEDLRLAGEIGVGSATAALIDPATGSIGRYRRVEVLDLDADTITVSDAGAPEVIARQAYDGDPAQLVPGRRLHAVRVASALRCWA